MTGDGDPHRQTEPDVLAPPTAVELLTRVLSRDGAQTSATTTVRQLADPARQLADAAARYTDAVHVAAQQHLGPERLLALDVTVEQVLPGLTDAPAWPALRDRLTLLATAGNDPAAVLQQAVAQGELQGARDLAAVLSWRLTSCVTPPRPPDGVTHEVTSAPPPWLTAPPQQLADDPTWGPYLLARHAHTIDLATQVATRASQWTAGDAAGWASPLFTAQAPPDLVGRVAVWRAAQSVDDTDLRPTGAPADTAAALQAQQSLDREIDRALHDPHDRDVSRVRPWTRPAMSLEPRLLSDPTWPRLAEQLDRLEQTGIDATALLRDALRQRPLPDELPAAALLSRLPALSTHDRPGRSRPAAHDALPSAPPRPADLWRELGHRVDPRLVTGSDWPALAAAMDRAHRDGYDLQTHLPDLAAQDPLPDEQPARTLQRRLAQDCPASRLTIPPEVQRRLDRELADRARERMRTSDLASGGRSGPRPGPAPGGVRR